MDSLPLKGKKAFDLLQGQFTCDVKEVTAQQSRLGAHCDQKGRIQSTFRLFQFHDIYYMQLPISLSQHALQQLKKYSHLFRITPKDVSGDFKIIGLNGSEIETVLTELNIPIPQTIDSACTFQDHLIIRVPGNSLPRFMIYGDPSSIDQLLLKMNQHSLLTKADDSAWKLLDISAGLAAIYPQTIGEFTPHHLNYPALNAVNFKKGCYIGQEIVARMQYLGKLKQHLQCGVFNESATAEPGTKLYNNEGQEVGTIIDVATDIENNQHVVLAVIADNALDKPLYIGIPNGSVVTLIENSTLPLELIRLK